MTYLPARLGTLALGLALVIPSRVALACMCGDAPPAEETFKNSDVIFVGMVEAVIDRGMAPGAVMETRSINYQRATRLLVTEAFKGTTAGATEVVFSGTGGGDCGIRPAPGDDVVMVAFGRPLRTSMCALGSMTKEWLRSRVNTTAPRERAASSNLKTSDCRRPESWADAVKRAEVVIDGHALSSCLDGGAGETLAHVYVSGRSKGVAERMVEVITPERLELGHVLILGAWKDGRVVADPCLTPARPKTPGRPYDEKVEIEVEMVMSRHYHERRNALGSLPTDPPAEEVAWPKGPDGRSIPTACGGLTNEIFEGTPGSPGGTVEFAARSPVPKTHGRGCGSCAATSSNGAGGGAALLLTFIVLAASRRLRGEN